jgi:hypothetical protein
VDSLHGITSATLVEAGRPFLTGKSNRRTPYLLHRMHRLWAGLAGQQRAIERVLDVLDELPQTRSRRVLSRRW